MGKNAWQNFIAKEAFAASVRDLVEFLFPRRLHRLDFFLRLLATEFMSPLIEPHIATTTPALLQWVPDIIVSIYILFFVILPRFRDIGMNGWALLGLIPPANFVFSIILLFRAPSYQHPNTESGSVAAIA